MEGGESMAILSEPVRSSLKISFGGDDGSYTVSRLNAEASADSLLLLAEAVNLLQGIDPQDLIRAKEYRLVSE
ncbi:MAG: hypothetical protein LBS84_03785 [Clostridiales bacterium]|jgi:hypothetical protein|nr:hypothetical protein [Clostridiales bacterium]